MYTEGGIAESDGGDVKDDVSGFLCSESIRKSKQREKKYKGGNWLIPVQMEVDHVCVSACVYVCMY